MTPHFPDKNTYFKANFCMKMREFIRIYAEFVLVKISYTVMSKGKPLILHVRYFKYSLHNTSEA